MNNQKLAWTEMLADFGDESLPSEVMLFLEKTLQISEFKSCKQTFEEVGELPSDQIDIHLRTSYSLINFWKNLYISSVVNVNSDIVHNNADIFHIKKDIAHDISLDEPDFNNHKAQFHDNIDVKGEPQTKVEADVEVFPSTIPDDDDDDDEDNNDDSEWLVSNAVTSKNKNQREQIRKRGRPKKPSPDSDVEHPTQGKPKRKRGRPKKPSSDRDVEPVTHRKPKRKVGRPKKPSQNRDEESECAPRKYYICRLRDALPTFKCRLCNKSLRTFNHMTKAHGEEYANACPLCEDMNVTDIIYHLNVSHLRKTPLKCGICPSVWFCQDELEKHRLRHTSINRVACKQCRLWFPDEQSCDDHVKSDHAVENAPNWPEKSAYAKRHDTIFCETCGASFEGPRHLITRRLSRHQQTAHMSHTNIYKCNVCDKGFLSRGPLNRHHLTHSDVRPFLCDYPNCNKKFKSVQYLRQHKMFHGEPKIVCQICGNKFFLRCTLKAHLTTCSRSVIRN